MPPAKSSPSRSSPSESMLLGDDMTTSLTASARIIESTKKRTNNNSIVDSFQSQHDINTSGPNKVGGNSDDHSISDAYHSTTTLLLGSAAAQQQQQQHTSTSGTVGNRAAADMTVVSDASTSRHPAHQSVAVSNHPLSNMGLSYSATGTEGSVTGGEETTTDADTDATSGEASLLKRRNLKNTHHASSNRGRGRSGGGPAVNGSASADDVAPEPPLPHIPTYLAPMSDDSRTSALLGGSSWYKGGSKSGGGGGGYGGTGNNDNDNTVKGANGGGNNSNAVYLYKTVAEQDYGVRVASKSTIDSFNTTSRASLARASMGGPIPSAMLYHRLSMNEEQDRQMALDTLMRTGEDQVNSHNANRNNNETKGIKQQKQAGGAMSKTSFVSRSFNTLPAAVTRSQQMGTGSQQHDDEDRVSSSLAEVSRGRGRGDSNVDSDGVEVSDLTCWEIFRSEICALKWRVLALATLLPLGSYYVYDFPAVFGTGTNNDTIQALFQREGKSYTQPDNFLLYSVYSYPNIALSVFGGFLIDRVFGLRKTLVMFSALITLGAIIFWIGVLKTSYPVLMTGRVVYSLGAESLLVAQSTLIARWFTGRDVRGYTLAFCLCVSVSRVGAALNYVISPRVTAAYSVETACLIGALLCAFSFLAAILLVVVDYYAEYRGLIGIEAASVAPRFKCSDLKKFGLRPWVIFLVCAFIYAAVFGYNQFAPLFLEKKYEFKDGVANDVASIFAWVSALSLPMSGVLVDLYGRRSFVLSISCVAIAGCLFALLFNPISSIPSVAGIYVLYALSYSGMVSSVWTMVPYVVDVTDTGFAYGLMTGVQAVALAVIPVVTGTILDRDSGAAVDVNATTGQMPELPDISRFREAFSVFLGCAVVASLLAWFLIVVDRKMDGMLGLSAKAADMKIQDMLVELEADMYDDILSQVRRETPATDIAVEMTSRSLYKSQPL